jgi:two-component system, NarL family, nitrate/nitrite response regulator NarL
MQENKIKIAIVDDHQIIIDGLVALLNKHPLLMITATANDGANMLQLLEKTLVDVLLTDVMMPGMNGMQLAKSVKEKFPAIKIIALSMSGQGDTVEAMINDADIAGYILKQTNAEEIANAIIKVHEGGIYFQDEILKQLAIQANIKKDISAAHITQREKQLIALIEKEFTSRDIAQQLSISMHTVETHRKNIFRKTGTNNILSLVKWAYEHKILIKE